MIMKWDFEEDTSMSSLKSFSANVKWCQIQQTEGDGIHSWSCNLHHCLIYHSVTIRATQSQVLLSASQDAETFCQPYLHIIWYNKNALYQQTTSSWHPNPNTKKNTTNSNNRGIQNSHHNSSTNNITLQIHTRTENSITKTPNKNKKDHNNCTTIAQQLHNNCTTINNK